MLEIEQIDSEGHCSDQESESSSTDNSGKSEQGSLHNDGNFRGIQYAFSKILNPTHVSIIKQDRAEILKNQFSQLKIEVMPMFINLDFKDIDLIYTLYSRYFMTIQKEINAMFAPPQQPQAAKTDKTQA